MSTLDGAWRSRPTLNLSRFFSIVSISSLRLSLSPPPPLSLRGQFLLLLLLLVLLLISHDSVHLFRPIVCGDRELKDQETAEGPLTPFWSGVSVKLKSFSPAFAHHFDSTRVNALRSSLHLHSTGLLQMLLLPDMEQQQQQQSTLPYALSRHSSCFVLHTFEDRTVMGAYLLCASSSPCLHKISCFLFGNEERGT